MDPRLLSLPEGTRSAVEQASAVLVWAQLALAAKESIAARAGRWLKEAEARADVLQEKMASVRYATRGRPVGGVAGVPLD